MSFFSISILAVSSIIILLIFKKLKFSQILFAVLSGIAALLCCDVIMSLFGHNMPINIYTVSLSAFGGIPAVILLVLLKTFLLY